MADDLANLPMNFHVSADERVRAAIIGVPAFMRRKRLLEDMVAMAVEDIRALRAAGEPDSTIAAKIDVGRINEVLARHNRFYPIEANLPLDPRTGVLMERGGREAWKPLPPWTFDALATLADAQ